MLKKMSFNPIFLGESIQKVLSFFKDIDMIDKYTRLNDLLGKVN
jgi:hypothetical protein